MTTLLISTRNLYKVAEIQAILGPQFECQTLKSFPNAPEVREDQCTFAGNAKKKSEELSRWIVSEYRNPESFQRLPDFVLADDSGLEVDALDGAPGVYSARFAGLDDGSPGNSPTAANNTKLLGLLANVPAEKRTARFRCVIALTSTQALAATRISTVETGCIPLKTELFEGVCEGILGFKPSGQGGFGYDPLFIPLGQRLTFAELGEEIKNQLSHRALALGQLKRWLSGSKAGSQNR